MASITPGVWPSAKMRTLICRVVVVWGIGLRERTLKVYSLLRSQVWGLFGINVEGFLVIR